MGGGIQIWRCVTVILKMEALSGPILWDDGATFNPPRERIGAVTGTAIKVDTKIKTGVGFRPVEGSTPPARVRLSAYEVVPRSMKIFLGRIVLLLCAPIGLVACQADNPSAKNHDPASRSEVSAPAILPAYDFERNLQVCVGTICKLGTAEKMKMSDYSADLINGMRLSQSDTLSDARNKLAQFYGGMVSSSLGGTTDPKLKLLSAQLSPGTEKNLPEYDVVIRTKGISNGARVHDWGARIRCAPITANTPWQSTPCR